MIRVPKIYMIARVYYLYTLDKSRLAVLLYEYQILCHDHTLFDVTAAITK